MKYLALITILVLAACTTFEQQTFEGEGLQQFSSEAEFRAFTEQAPYYGAAYRGAPLMARTTEMSMDAAYSETNVQVQGIDEADFVKTDGEYLYVLSNNIINIMSKELDDLSAIKSPSNLYYEQLFIQDDLLIVLGRERGYRDATTHIHTYDITDRENPQLEDELEISGVLREARFTNGVIYTITIENQAVPIPYLRYAGSTEKIMPTDIWYDPYPHQSTQVTTVAAVQADDLGSAEMTAVVTESNAQVYMSESNIYLAGTEYVNTWEYRQEASIAVVESLLSESDQSRVEKIRNADPDLLTDAEKQSKITQIVSEYLRGLDEFEEERISEEIERAYNSIMLNHPYQQVTHITKISYDGLDLDVAADASFNGNLNNQFAMDEQDGVLRVAATLTPTRGVEEFSEEETSTSVYTFDEELTLLGEISGIAKTERIYSTRFIQEKLYLVTFRQVDPFFVVDLADPSNPEILGELKIPGFSRYLHPYDNETIIGIGREATSEGRVEGVKISLFDVSDFSAPEEVATYTVKSKSSSSAAEWDHKAFLFDKELELLVLPINDWNWQSRDHFSGAYVFTVTKDDISLRETIEHSDEYDYREGVQRSLYIDDLLYTISYSSVHAHTLPDIDWYGVLKLEEGEKEPPILVDPIFR